VLVNNLIADLHNSSYGILVGLLFVGCLFYADDIVLLSPSCCSLQRLTNVCEDFALYWDIKFNPRKSQLITLHGKNPYGHKLCMYMLLYHGLKRLNT